MDRLSSSVRNKWSKLTTSSKTRKAKTPTRMEPVIPESETKSPYAQPQSFDTNILVGPVYEGNNKRRRSVIKQELSDITKRLHKTLESYDTQDTFEETSDEDYLGKMRTRVNSLASTEMKHHLNQFLSRYEDMTTSANTATRERDELLMQLADWFTTDHADLDAKVSLNEKEEKDLSKSYAETLATFEKFKKLQQHAGSDSGRKSQILLKEKRNIGKQMFENMQTMRTISIQTMKVQSADNGFTPWKDAADEIVGMLKKTRLESAEEIETLSNRMYELLGELEKQQQVIKSLERELRREKTVKNQLADDCTDVKVKLVQATETIKKYEKDLQKAKEMIEKQLKEISRRDRELEGEEEEDSEDSDLEISHEKLNAIMGELMGDDDNQLKEMPSDPYILRTRLRQQEDTIASLSNQIKEMDLKMRDNELIIEGKENALSELAKENTQLINKVSSLEKALSTEKQKSAKMEAKLLTPKKSGRLNVKGSFTCMKCQQKKEESKELEQKKSSMKSTKESQSSVAQDAEIEKLKTAVQHFKKLLSDTELKLSQAYKEISDLRLQQTEQFLQESKAVLSVTEELFTEEPDEPKIKSESPPVQEVPIEEQPDEFDKDTVIPEKPKTAETSKETSKTQNVKRSRKDSVKLPPLVRQPTKFSRQEVMHPAEPQDQETKREREQTLYKVGDLQSKMHVIVNMVMDFVTTVGSMIYKDPSEDQTRKLQNMKAFQFGTDIEVEKTKELSPKQQEAKQKKTQAFFQGQKISGLLKEVYDMLSSSLNLQHSELESIYRSFKKHQKKRAIGAAIIQSNVTTPGTRSYDKDSGGGKRMDIYGVSRTGGYHSSAEFAPWHSEIIPSSSVEDVGQQNILVHGMYRSKSDLDVHSNFSTESFTTQLLRERSQVFITHSPTDMQHGRKTALGNHGTPSREEVFVAKTTVPKKGLIKLTSFDKELKNPMLFNKQEKEVLPMQAVREKQRKQQISEKKKKMLIRRKDIQNQVDLGTLYLANEEEKNLIETQIENYTLADLHQNLNELTKQIKQPPTENLPRGGHKQISNTKSTTPQPRGLALPAINTINIF